MLEKIQEVVSIELFHCKFCLSFGGEWQANLKL
jgi:hypothetical protein